MELISTTLSTTPITRTEFDFINENLVDRLKIIFFEGTHQLSEISFELYPIKKISSQKYPDFTVFCNEISNSGVHKIADVYPLNGTVRKLKETDNPDGSVTREPFTFKINNHFESKHRKQILTNVIKLKSNDIDDFVRVMVIDFKDTKNSYINRNEIWKTEQAFADFFTGIQPDNKKESRGRLCTYKLIKDNSIKFVINEGTLKADLMANTFTPTQKKYFAKEGLELCQVCEIIMNGFKQG
ncbi:MAG: hypothetical protein H0U27_10335, partial [Nitrosopumilus sp.]|nr:hypothetical protein [Nitrosopumilus sp.]